jgi:hypothetical protein
MTQLNIATIAPTYLGKTLTLKEAEEFSKYDGVKINGQRQIVSGNQLIPAFCNLK